MSPFPGIGRVLEQNVDERRDRRALGEHDQASKQEQNNANWQQPKFLSNPQELPKFSEKREHVLDPPTQA